MRINTAHSQSRAHRGIAWYPSNSDFGALEQLGASCYYNGSSYRHVTNGRAIPIIRPRYAHDNIPAALGKDYAGPVLVLNEPERVTQDNMAPQTAVVEVQILRRYLPRAQFIGPNILIGTDGLAWLETYLERGGKAFDGWGIHFYPQSGMSARQAILELRKTLARHDMDGSRIWITEIGAPHTATNAEVWLAKKLDTFGRSPYVEMIFGYTSGEARPASLAMIVDGELTSTGRAFVK